MQEEPRNLCNTCWYMTACFEKGITSRETCDDYTPLSLELLHEQDEFIDQIKTGACPKCGSNNTYDCDNPLELIVEDNTIGYCLDCSAYWCLECGYVFKEIRKHMQCPHWRLCAECSDEHGYLDGGQFIEEICPSCEHYDDGCMLEDPLKCEKQSTFLCPYADNVSACPKVKGLIIS